MNFFILLLTFLTVTLQAQPQLILNTENESVMPRNFRTTSEWGLKASASGQFSENGLPLLLKAIPSTQTDIIIIDLREESHGFINGIAISWRGENNWANQGKSPEEIAADEKTRLQLLQEEGYALLHVKNLPDVEYLLIVEKSCTEKELIAKTQADYVHIPTSDYLHPSDRAVDSFLTFIKALPDQKWLHFHCSAGKGRSSLFLAMYDMLQNAHTTGFCDILERQKKIGSSDFLSPVDPRSQKYPFILSKRHFLIKFYDYCVSDRSQSWSQWNSTH